MNTPDTRQAPQQRAFLSDKIFDEISGNATGKKAASLARLKEACDALSKKGGQLRLADIEREIVKRHGSGAGPKAQSIANDKEGMRRYVDAREREIQSSGQPGGRRPANQSFALLLDSVKDQDSRSRLLELHDRCRIAETSFARAKALLTSLEPGADIDALLAGRSSGLVMTRKISADPEHVDALRSLAGILGDEKKLAAAGLVREPGGRVRRKSGTGDELVPPSVITALDAMSKALGS